LTLDLTFEFENRVSQHKNVLPTYKKKHKHL
jgi:hypothetical protein